MGGGGRGRGWDPGQWVSRKGMGSYIQKAGVVAEVKGNKDALKGTTS
jgi:hypothetical protein